MKSTTKESDPVVDPKETPDSSPSASAVAISPEERLAQAEAIVKNNVRWSMGVGLVPVPIVDLIGVGGFQVRMIKALSDLYEVKFSEHAARNILTALVGSVGARAVAGITMGSLIKAVPGIGGVVSCILALPLISGAFTYGVGRVFVRHFESGGTFLDLNVEKCKSYFKSQFQEGKKVVAEKKPGAAVS